MNDLIEHPDLAQFVSDTVGSVPGAHLCRPVGPATRLWRIELAGGGTAYLKAHSQQDHYARELAAYREFAPRLEGLTPRLLGSHDPPQSALLLTEVPGDNVSRAFAGRRNDCEFYHQAGAFLARLHSLRCDARSAAEETLQLQLDKYALRAREHLSIADIDWVRSRASRVVSEVARVTPVPCHRDFTPRNWVAGPDGVLRFIDFEHARPDVWFFDVERMWAREWQSRPDRADAFWDGYGRRLTRDETELLSGYSAYKAMSTIVWAAEHGDKQFEQQGRNTLSRLRSRS